MARCQRRFNTVSAMFALLEHDGQATTSPPSNPNTVTNRCETWPPQCVHSGIKSPERALHLEFDEPVELNGVLDGQFLRDRLDEPRDDHLFRVVVVETARLEVEDVLVADLADGRLVGDVDFRLVDLHVRIVA